LKIFSAEEAILLLLGSERVFHDLHQAELTNSFPMKIAIRKFVEFDTVWEFRLFVSKGQPTAATAYHKLCYIKEIRNNKASIEARLLNHWSSVKSTIKCEEYALDIALVPNSTNFYVIELNYPPPIASCILYDWSIAEDRNILQNGPFTLRCVEEPTQDACSLLNDTLSTWINLKFK